MTTESVSLASASQLRVRAFVDFWNFSLSLKKWRDPFKVDWAKLGPWLSSQAGKLVVAGGAGAAPSIRYEGLHVYLSYDPKKPEDGKLRNWASNVLDRFPGVELVVKERRPKGPPKCPQCHSEIVTCPHCNAGTHGTMEKGIDTAIVTDMIRLAWEDSYDLAVLVSSDRDFIPGVEFLNSKGRKVVNACFPPRGRELANKCWASLDLTKILQEVERP
jgi:uncharacterized LabA/DUF88 family protein